MRIRQHAVPLATRKQPSASPGATASPQRQPVLFPKGRQQGSAVVSRGCPRPSALELRTRVRKHRPPVNGRRLPAAGADVGLRLTKRTDDKRATGAESLQRRDPQAQSHVVQDKAPTARKSGSSPSTRGREGATAVTQSQRGLGALRRIQLRAEDVLQGSKQASIELAAQDSS